MSNEIKVPKIPHAFFKWYCKQDRYEEIHGDLEEIFYERAEKSGAALARLMYTLDVIRCCQPYAWKRRRSETTAGLALYRNYFKVAVRGLGKTPVNSIINIFGLSVAIGICILVYGFFQWDYNIDRFHVSKEKIYLVTWFGVHDSTLTQYGTSPRALGAMLKQDFGSVEKICRIEEGNAIIKYEDHVFHERISFVDPEYLEMFTFPLKWGSAQSLYDHNSIVLSEEMSTKYFGTDNPVGRDVLLKFNEREKKLFKVGGVAHSFPRAHDLEFNFLINYSNLKTAAEDSKEDDWKKLITATFVQIDDAASARRLELGMEKYRILQNEAHHNRPVQSFALEQFATLHQRAGHIRDAVAHDFNAEGRIGLTVIAILMLSLACFNYINIAIVSAVRRLKEMGVRKVVGATRWRMVVQYLSENLVITWFALIVGFILSITVFIPWFEHFSGGEMLFDVLDRKLFVFLFVLLILTAVASGLYPAIYIAKFEAVKIFKGSVEIGKKNPLTKLLLGVEMMLACVLITTGVVFTQNNAYQSGLDWGYNQRGLLYASLPDSTSFRKLYAAMISEPGVTMIAGSADHLGRENPRVVLALPDGKQYEADQFSVEGNYFETMGFELSNGRWLVERSERDKHSVVINELLANAIGLKNTPGSTFEIDSVKYEVVGVVKDFHSKNLFREMQPSLFLLAEEPEFQFLSIRVTPGEDKKVLTSLQAHWSKLFPETPFQGGYQQDTWGIYFERVARSERFSIIVASIAVLLATIGLFGLVTINVSGRTKEFSIRKTLGAMPANIMAVIVNQYVLLLTAALVFGVPLSFIFAKASLNMLFAYPMPINYSGIAIGGTILVAIFCGVVLTQVRKVIRTNPVEGLKTD